MTKKIESKYAELGVDAKKKGLEPIKRMLDNMFPNAFCTMVPDPTIPEYAMFSHTDGGGSKPVESYVHFKGTGNIQCFAGLADDIIAMNLDDIICVAPEAEAMMLVDYIALNPLRIPKQALLNCLVPAFKKRLKNLKRYGINIKFLGGEAADLTDQLRTVDVSGTISGRAAINNVITGEKIKPGNIIIELRSGGRAYYEKNQNSGIMCNGISLPRHYLTPSQFSLIYPEIKDPDGKDYCGRFKWNKYLDQLGMTVGDAIISPTRIYAPIIKRVFREYGIYITGLIHNTGGGQTKCLKVGNNIHYKKGGKIDGKEYNLFNPDPIFYLIQQESGESWEKMHEDCNLGGGFEIIVQDENVADAIIDTIEKFGIEAKVVGKCFEGDGRNKVTIDSKFGKFEYT